MEYAVVGWPADGPALDLDHRQFAYAGKFVMSDTGKAVAREEDAVVGAAAFSPDRTDPARQRLRYVTVRRDRRGERVGPRLCGFAARCLLDRGADRVTIAVNNPFAYVALYRAGFGFTGEETGLAELVLERPGPRGRYAEGLDRFRDRDDLPESARTYLAEAGDEPPERVADPDGDCEAAGQ